MDSYKDLQYQGSIRYKMLRILKGFRRGLNVSFDFVAKKMYYTGSMLRYYEEGKTQIKEETLRYYVFVIAKMLEFDQMDFYELLLKEASQIQDGTSIEILKAISHLMSLEPYPNQLKKNLKQENEKNLFSNMMMILACFRRILMIGIVETMDILQVANLNQRELGCLNAKKEYVQKYARFIAEHINCKDFEKFYGVLEKEAAKMEASKEHASQNAIKALGRIVKQIY